MPRQNSTTLPEKQPLSDWLAALKAVGCEPKKTGVDSWNGPCPLCAGEDRFHLKDDPPLVGCRGCIDGQGEGNKRYGELCRLLFPDSTRPTPRRRTPTTGNGSQSRPRSRPRRCKTAANLPEGEHVTRYQYDDADGTPFLWQVRYDHPHPKAIKKKATKTFEVWHKTPECYVGEAPKGPRPLYGLPNLLTAKQDFGIMVFEGEKCAEAARKAWPSNAATITTYSQGGGNWKLTDWMPLKGRTVHLVADADVPGRKAMQALAGHLHGLGCSVKLALPEGNTKADVVEWIAEKGAGGALEYMRGLLKPYAPPETVSPVVPPGRDGEQRIDDEATGVQFTIPGGKTHRGLENALGALGIEIRFDLRDMQEQFRRDEHDWRHINDQAFDALRAEIAERCSYETQSKGAQSLTFGRDSFRSALNALMYYRNCDPFKDWLLQLPSWDKDPRLDAVLCDLFEVPSTPLSIWAAQYVFVGAIQRTLDPGCRLDEVPVFVGPGRCGKSAFCREVLPPEYPDWFGDTLDLAEDARRCAEALDGVVVCEIPEMQGATRADLRRLKSFLSRRNDKIRRAYARSTESCPRRSVFLATTDDAYSLPNDKAGNRRFVPVDLPGRGHVEPFMADGRVQLWAEALHRYRDGVRANLPAALFDNQAEAVEAHRRASEAVEQHCATFLHRHDGVTLAEMIQETDFTEHQMRDAAALLCFRRERKRMDGKLLRLWFPPEPSEVST